MPGKTVHHRRGNAIGYVAIMIPVFVALASFAVDFGRVQIAKSQLRLSIDSAARGGVSCIASGVAAAQNAAVAIAGANVCDGTAVVVDPNLDIDFGTWDENARTFTVLSGVTRANANALRVFGKRTAARSNPIPLIFGGVIGFGSCDVSTSAIAMVTQSPGTYGINCLSKFDIKGSVDSYDSSSGQWTAGSALSNGTVGCNGTIKLGSASIVHGDAHPGPGIAVTGGAVTGSSSSLTTPITAPAATYGTADTVNNNASLPGSYFNGTDYVQNGGSATWPAGVYYIGKFTLNSGAVVNTTPQTTIYVNGAMAMTGSATLNASGRPSELKLTILGTNGMSMSGTTWINAVIYAPGSKVDMSNTATICGAMTADQIKDSGSSQFHVDESLHMSSTSSVKVALVK